MVHVFVKHVLAASAATRLAIGAANAESAIPDLKGVWTGKFTGGFLFGDMTHLEDPTVPKSVAKKETQWIVTIEKQDGTGLAGTVTAAGSTKVETILGVIRHDGKTILFSDNDTTFQAVLISPTEMEVCAQEAGTTDIVAACWLLKKQ